MKNKMKNGFKNYFGTMLNKLKYFDWMLFIPYILLCIIGIVMVYSASSINLSYVGISSSIYMQKQVIYVLAGVVLMFLVAHLNTRWWVNSGFLIFFGISIIFLLTYVYFFGQSVNGAKGWINLKFINLQPSEFAKIFIILYCASWFSKFNYNRDLGIKNKTLKLNLIVGIILFEILIEPDMGGFAISAAIILIMYLAYRNPATSKFHISSNLILIGLIIVIPFILQVGRIPIVQSMAKNSYKIQRFVAFTDPFKYVGSIGRQLVNSYYAISNGGLLGRGLGNSIEKRGYLPEPYTDFILSVTTEELGFIGTIILLLLIFAIILRIFLIGIRSNNIYNRLICYGTGTLILVEAIFNIGAVIGWLPITGVTLPFVSYGGSSMLVLSMALGFVMNISSNQRRHTEYNPFEKYNLKVGDGE